MRCLTKELVDYAYITPLQLIGGFYLGPSDLLQRLAALAAEPAYDIASIQQGRIGDEVRPPCLAFLHCARLVIPIRPQIHN